MEISISQLGYYVDWSKWKIKGAGLLISVIIC